MQVSKVKLNVNIDSRFKLLKGHISIINPMHVLLFDCDGIVEPIDSLLKFLQPKNHDLHKKKISES